MRLAWVITACLALPAAAAPPPVRVVASIPPVAWFVEQVAGDLATVSVLLGPGDSPATYEPTARDMTALQDADLFLGAGVPFEHGLRPRIAGLVSGPAVAGPEPALGHHHDGGLDPHTWLSPAGARALADTVAARLAALRPDSAHRFRAGRAAVETIITRTDAEVRDVLAGRRGGTFLVFHPAFGHFAAAYGLRQLAVEHQGHEPGARHLAEVTSAAREARVGAVVVQPQFSGRTAAMIAGSLDVPVVELDPLAREWDRNLVHIARTLARVVSAAPGDGP